MVLKALLKLIQRCFFNVKERKIMQTFLIYLYILKEVSAMILFLVAACSIACSGYRVYKNLKEDKNKDK